MTKCALKITYFVPMYLFNKQQQFEIEQQIRKINNIIGPNFNSSISL